MSLKGGCFCGRVRYEVQSDPFHGVKCHCRDCQMISGSGYLPLLWYKAGQIKIDDSKLKYFARTSDGETTVRHGFCEECSSPVLVKPTFDEMDVVFLVATTLDNPSIFTPRAEIWVSSAQHWDCLDESIEQVSTQRTGKLAR